MPLNRMFASFQVLFSHSPGLQPCLRVFATLYHFAMDGRIHQPHHHAPVSAEPGFSLLRLSAAKRVSLALVVIAALWVATLAVIA